MKVLNLGCGKLKHEFPEANHATEIVGIDLSEGCGADICHNLNIVPWPVPPDAFDLVIMQDVVEHLDSLTATLREAYRVLKPEGILRIRTPHYSCYYAHNDPTHVRCYGGLVFQWFEREFPNNPYSDCNFVVKKKEILFPKIWRLCGVAALANRHVARWEQLFAYVFKAENMVFELSAVKSK